MFDSRFANEGATELLDNLWTDDPLFVTRGTLSTTPTMHKLSVQSRPFPENDWMPMQASWTVTVRNIVWLDLVVQQCECGAGGRDPRNPRCGPQPWLDRNWDLIIKLAALSDRQRRIPYGEVSVPHAKCVYVRQSLWCDLHLKINTRLSIQSYVKSLNTYNFQMWPLFSSYAHSLQGKE